MTESMGEKEKLKRAQAAYAEFVEHIQPPQKEKQEPESASAETPASTVAQTQDEVVQETVAPASEFTALQEKFEQVKQENQKNFEGWQRERADFLNYKRRIEREQAQLSQSLSGSIIKKYLVVLDDLERALKTRPTQGEGATWAEGLDLIYRKLNNILEAEGIKTIQAENTMFDPTQHEAITHEESPDFESGQVIEVIQKGYTLGDRVLRPALVRVAR